MAGSAADVEIVITAVNKATEELRKARDDIRNVEKAAKDSAGGLTSMTSASSKLNGALGTVAKTAAGFLAANVITQGARAFTSQFGSIISGASDLNESMSKSAVVFGQFNSSVETFAATSAKSFGVSKQAAFEAASTFGNLFTAMGLGQKEAADLSVPLVKLAADLASFNNISIDDALLKLRSGLVGEVEPLRTLGVQINAATVEAKAMELGLADASGEISEAAKVQARYALILEQTGTAQGDFARTSGGLANQQRILKAQFADLKAGIGQALLPVMVALVKVLASRVVPAIGAAAEHLQNFVGTIKASLKGDVGRAAELFNKLPKPLQTLALFLAKNEDAIRGFLSGVKNAVQGAAEGAIAFGKWLQESGTLSNALLGLQTIGEGLLLIIEAISPAVARVIKFFKDNKVAAIALGIALAAVFAPIPLAIIAVIVALGYLRRHFDDIKRFAKDVWGKIPDPIVEALKLIVDTAKFHFDTLKNLVETAFGVVSGVFKTLKAIWEGDWSEAWEGIKQIGTTLLDGIVRDIGLKLQFLERVFAVAFAGIRKIFQAAFDALRSAGETALNWLIDKLNSVLGALNKAIDAFNKLPGNDIGNIPTIPNVGGNTPQQREGTPPAPFLPRLHSGSSFIPRDMVALLRRGERVLTPEQNREGWGGNVAYITITGGGDSEDLVRRLTRELRDQLGFDTLAGPRIASGAFTPGRA